MTATARSPAPPTPDRRRAVDRRRSSARSSTATCAPRARVPQLLMFSLTMPMAMLVLFSQVFRSVADGPGFPAGVSYIDFLTPAMLAVATVMAGTNAGVAAAIDHTNGLHDRFADPADATRAARHRPHDQRDGVHRRPAPSCWSVRPRCSGSGSTATRSTPSPGWSCWWRWPAR